MSRCWFALIVAVLMMYTIVQGPPPAAGQTKTREAWTPSLVLIHFNYDHLDIEPSEVPKLQQVIKWMLAHPEKKLLIEGHSDRQGTNEYKLAVGEKIAKNVMNYMGERGVPSMRLTIVSYGNERAKCLEEGCSANSRVKFLVCENRVCN